MSDNKDNTPDSSHSEMQEHIGRKLREMYNHVAQQPIPDRFLALLDQLDTAQDPAKGA